MTQDGRLGREKGDDVLVPVHLAGVFIVPLNDLAEGAALAFLHRHFVTPWSAQEGS